MSLIHRKHLALSMLCTSLAWVPTARAQDEVVSVTRRAYGPDDVGRLVDANWNPVGRTRLPVEVLTGPGNGVDREVRSSLGPNEVTANASAFPAAAAMRRAQANGYVRVMDIETVYQTDPSSLGTIPAGTEGQFYIHAVYVGRVHQRQFFGATNEVSGAVSAAGEGQGITPSVRSARVVRGYQAPRAADEALLLGTADAETLRGLLRARGRAAGVLVVFRRVRANGTGLPRGRVTFSAPVEIPLEGESLHGEPDYDPAAVSRLMRTRGPQLTRCYDQSLRANPVQRGVLTVRFTLTPDGRTADVTSSSPDLMQDIPTCVTRAVERFRSNPVPETPVRFEVRMTMVPQE